MADLVWEASAGVRILVSPALRSVGTPHLFAARDLGAHFEPSLGPGEGPPVAAWFGADTRVFRLDQVHGADVFDVDAAGVPGTAPPADAAFTTAPDVALGVRVADCVPVLVASTDGRQVAAIHAGWRGLVAGVIPAALARFGTEEKVAAVGPCLSLERFEVGPEVRTAFAAAALSACVDETVGPRPHVDLRRAAALQLERSGVSTIDVSSLCTWDDARFFSYRRDVTHGGAPATGRQGALISTRPRDGGPGA